MTRSDPSRIPDGASLARRIAPRLRNHDVVPGDPMRLIAGPDAREVVRRSRASSGSSGLCTSSTCRSSAARSRGIADDRSARGAGDGRVLTRFPTTLELTRSHAHRGRGRLPLGLGAASSGRPGSTTCRMGTSLSRLSLPIFGVAIVAIWLFGLTSAGFRSSGAGDPYGSSTGSATSSCPLSPSPRPRRRSSAGSRARACWRCSAASS